MCPCLLFPVNERRLKMIQFCTLMPDWFNVQVCSVRRCVPTCVIKDRVMSVTECVKHAIKSEINKYVVENDNRFF